MNRLIEKSRYQEIDKMFKDGKSVSDISRHLKVSRSAVYTVLKNLGIKIAEGVPKHQDQIGKKYGFLTIKSLIQRGREYHWAWRAICECSNCGKTDFETSIQNVLRGRTTSCGCRKDFYTKLTGKNSVQFTGYEEIRGKTWSTICRRARNRGRSVDVSIQDVWEIYEKQNRKCALSGIPIAFGKINSETTASLDRIDSSRGYVKDNVQWVHKDVNIMKNVFSVEYFLEMCTNVVSTIGKVK